MLEAFINLHPDLPMAVLPFVSPWLFAGGAAATSIPVVIHLLNRRRFRVKQWAAMEFLLAAMRRNVRRLRLQRWLLLLLRILAILILAAAIAQFTPVGAALAPLLGSSQKLTVVVINNAYPMSLKPHGRRTAFERARQLVVAWLKSGTVSGKTAIIPASVNASSIAPEPVIPSAELIRRVSRMRASQGGENLAGALQQALEIVKKQKNRSSSRTVWLLTDDGADNFGTIGGDHRVLSRRMAALLADIRRAGARVRIIDLGSATARNMAITSLTPAHPAILTDKPVAVDYTVFNAAKTAARDVTLRFYLNSTPAGDTTLHSVPPGRLVRGEALLHEQAGEAGPLAITARLAPDALPADNTRRVIAMAQRHIPVLIVEGRPGDPAVGQLASTAWLGAALAPYRHGNSFKPQRIGELELADHSLKQFSAVVLSDTPAPGTHVAARLRKYVTAGGLLVIYPGPDTTGSQWSDTMGTGANGLLPAAMGAVMTPAGKGKSSGDVGFDLLRSINPVTAVFLAAEKGGLHTGLASVRTHQYMLLRPMAGSDSRTLLYFSNGAPALVERTIGRGHVLLWAVSADTQWTDFPAQPSFPAFIHRLMLYAMSNPAAAANMLVGQSVQMETRAAAGNWVGPDHSTLAVSRALIGGRPELTSEGISRSGFYGPADAAPAIAVNVDARWADVRHVPASQAARLWHINPRDILHNPTSLATAEPAEAGAGGNAGHNLLYLALAVLAIESITARAFSRYQLAAAKGK